MSAQGYYGNQGGPPPQEGGYYPPQQGYGGPPPPQGYPQQGYPQQGYGGAPPMQQQQMSGLQQKQASARAAYLDVAQTEHYSTMDHPWNPMGGFQPQATHHQHHHHQTPAAQAAAQYIPTPEQEVAVARQQMYESVHHLSASLRNAANQCDSYVKIIARHHPSAAATAFASNVGADFLALASGTSLGAQTLANHAAAVSGAAGGLTGNATPGRKALTKEEKKLLRKERKANRDPNAPKRPPSAYLLFQNEIREDMRQQYKDLTYSEVLGKISEAWKNLTEEQRKVYQDRTVENMQRWNVEKRQHQAGNGDGEFTNSGATVDDQDTQDAAAAAAAAAGHDLLSNGLINVDDATTGTATGEDGVDETTGASAAASNKRKGGAVKADKRARKN